MYPAESYPLEENQMPSNPASEGDRSHLDQEGLGLHAYNKELYKDGTTFDVVDAVKGIH